MKIEVEILNVEQINLSIDAVQNALCGKVARPIDYAPLHGVRGILEAIQKQAENNGSGGQTR
jgi:hypothetical protein